MDTYALDDADSQPIAERYSSVQSYDQYAKSIELPRITRSQVDRFRYEISRQPNWRREMAIDEDFYDGNQFTEDELDEYEDRGIPAIATNLVGPTIDLLLGMEAKTRTDWVVRPEAGDAVDDMALAMSQKLSLAEKQSRADDACSSALARQVKGGLGVIEVGFESDPFKYPYRVESHDWREFGFDPLGIKEDMSDHRFMRRSKFFDRTELEARFTMYAKQIHDLGPGYTGGYDGAYDGADPYFDSTPQLRASEGIYRDYSMRDMEWIDSDRDRLLLDEVWYRIFVRGQVLRLPDFTTIRFDQNNPIHLAAAESGAAKLIETSWAEVRVAFFIGPLRIQDVPTPFPHRDFPYVMFWGTREGRTRLPYGVIRRMRPMQKEINARSSKMMWALSARRITLTKGIVDDVEEVRQEGARPDALFELNNIPNGAFKIDDNQGISEQQYKILVDRVQRLQDVAGIYNTQLGKKDGGADSGIAINSLIEQGSTTVAPIFNTYRAARSRVGQMLLSLIIADMAGQENVPIKVHSARGKRTIMLNQPKVDERTGIQMLENDISRAKLKVTLDDIPATATFRQQQFLRISEFIGQVQKVNPEIAVKFLDLLVEASDVPNKQEFVDRVRESMGISGDPESMTPEQQQEMQAKQQAEAEQQAIAKAGVTAKIKLDEAKVAEIEARTQKMAADAAMSHETMMATMQKMLAEIQALSAKSALVGAQVDKTHLETIAIQQDVEMQAAAGLPDKIEAVLRW